MKRYRLSLSWEVNRQVFVWAENEDAAKELGIERWYEDSDTYDEVVGSCDANFVEEIKPEDADQNAEFDQFMTSTYIASVWQEGSE